MPSALSRADIQDPPKVSTKGERQLDRRTPTPPSPVAAKVRLQPGGSAEIILQANGALGKTISFLLRQPPAHGTFVAGMRRIGRDSVAVTYIHRATDGAGLDAFTFAVQAPGTAVSAAETVDIEVIDPSVATPPPTGLPELSAGPSELDFGAVEIGNSTVASFTLENRGSGPANGRVDPPPPWTVAGEPSYHLGPGARQSFRLVFLPHVERAFAEMLRIDAGNGDSTTGCAVRLVGTGLPRVARTELTVPTPAVLPVAGTDVASPPATSAVAATSPSATPAVRTGSGSGGSDAVLTNQARVTEVKVLAVTSSSVELRWRPPVPLPHSYRVERRSFARDDRELNHVRVDWLPYERVDIRVRADQVTAMLRGLAADTRVTVRVVSVDAAGQLSQPSPLINASTTPGSDWWHPTPLKGLLLLLAVCVGLIVRQRWQQRRAQEVAATEPAEELPLFSDP